MQVEVEQEIFCEKVVEIKAPCVKHLGFCRDRLHILTSGNRDFNMRMLGEDDQFFPYKADEEGGKQIIYDDISKKNEHNDIDEKITQN
jgi:hypothetical protein